MPDKAAVIEATPAEEGAPAAAAPATPPKRSPGHRGQDVRDTMAEMAARAHEISLEAGSKMAGALKDVINAAAGLTGFAVESARDLVQYMVRRGQMTQDEADKLIREAEEASAKRKPAAPAARSEPAAKAESQKAEAPRAETPRVAPKAAAPAKSAPAAKQPATAKDNGAAKKAAEPAKKAASKPATKAAAKAPAKVAAKAAVKRPAPVKASAKPAKPAAKPAAKGAKPAAKKSKK